jgi:hypothetical protein
MQYDEKGPQDSFKDVLSIFFWIRKRQRKTFVDDADSDQMPAEI